MIEAVANHLWQSTCFAAAALLASVAFRRNRAQVRYWLWFAASIKFLLPFSLLTLIGRQVGWRAAIATAVPALNVATRTVSEMLVRPDARRVIVLASATSPVPEVTHSTLEPVLIALWVVGGSIVLISWTIKWWRISQLVRRGVEIHDGARYTLLRRLENERGVRTPLRLVSSPALLEPGVFGILKPTLVWPEAIDAQLDEEQAEAILAHELEHVRRRDNLASAVHMVVQSVCWFYPVVWWSGARLVDERERACDEAVVAHGSEPEAYAESLLTACKVCLESSNVCLAGVLGANLKRRIEDIMTSRARATLSMSRKALLAFGAVATIVVPILVGFLQAPELRAQTQTIRLTRPAFEVASVKRNNSAAAGVRMMIEPGGRFVAIHVTLKQLIREAYQLQNAQLSGGPSWIATDTFDVNAKAADGQIVEPFSAEAYDQPNLLRQMLQMLLEDRFKLTVHHESREMPIFALVMARSDGRLGSQIKKSTSDCESREPGRGDAPRGQDTNKFNCGVSMGPGMMTASSTTMAQLAGLLPLGRITVDKTGLAGTFDFELRWTPDQSVADKPGAPGAPPPAIDPNGSSIFTALQEQLGLKADAQQGPVDVLVIDGAQPPTEN